MAGRTRSARERIAAHRFPRRVVVLSTGEPRLHALQPRTGGPVARLRPTGNGDRVQIPWWRRNTSGAPSDFGPVIMPLDEALTFIAAEGFFSI